MPFWFPAAPVEVTLNPFEVRICNAIAKARAEHKNGQGASSKMRDGRTDIEATIQAFGAELAFCRIANLYPELDVSDEYGGADCISVDGKKVQIKQTEYPTGRLQVADYQGADRCDIYVLMIGKLPRYKYVGYTLAERLFIPDRIGDLGRGKAYLMDQVDLIK